MSTFLPSPKTLDDIMKVQHLEGMQPEQIEALWMEVSPGSPIPHCFALWQTSGLTLALLQYHSDDTRQRAGSVMPAEEYRILKFRAAAAPLFVLPLGKGQGRSLSMLLQWQLPHCLITELDHYKQCVSVRTWSSPGTKAETPHLLHFGIMPLSLVFLAIILDAANQATHARLPDFAILVCSLRMAACRLGADARPHLMVTHYTELEHTKGLVLVRGDVLSPHIVSVPEVCAHCSRRERQLCTLSKADDIQQCDADNLCFVQARTLMALGSAFYVDPVNYLHVHNFNHDSSQFNYNQILQDLGHALPDGG